MEKEGEKGMKEQKDKKRRRGMKMEVGKERVKRKMKAERRKG